MLIELPMPSYCLNTLLPPPPPALNISQHQGLFQCALRIRWPKYWSFSISPSNAYSEFISFEIDWFDLLAAQGTLKSLLQHHSLKASVLQCSPFFMVELPHLYMITGKIIALTIWTLASQSSKIHGIDFFHLFVDWES